MKYFYIVLFLFTLTNSTLGQSLCLPNGISTNPDHPINPQHSNMENDFFDWRVEDFTDYFDPNFLNIAEPLFSPTNPYWSPEPYLTYLSGFSGTGNPQSLEVDYSPIEGWELITRGFGRYIDNSININFFNPYFLMYNKYSGKMRLLFNIPSAAVTGPYQTVEVHMFFNDPTSNNGIGPNAKYTGLMANIGDLSNGGISQPLDQETKTTRVVGIANFITTGWSHVEFDAAFDPCTCMDNSSIAFDFFGITSSDASLTGLLLGTATQADLFSNGAFNDTDRLMNVLKDGLNPQIGSEIFKSIDDWLDAVERAKNSSSSLLSSDFVTAIGDFAGLFSAAGSVISEFPKAVDFLKIKTLSNADKIEKYGKGITAIGKVAKGSSTLLKEFVSPASKKTFPSIIEAELALSGEILTSNLVDRTSFVIDNPGTSSSSNNTEYGNYQNPGYPFYNEVLGRFAILKTPTVTVFKENFFPDGIEEPFKRRRRVSFKLDESSMEYVFNPVLNIDQENTTIMATLVVETQGNPLRPDRFNFLDFEPTHRLDNGFSLSSNTVFLDCFGGFVNTYDYLNSPANSVDYDYEVFLRITIDYTFNELDRNGNKNRAMQILTYPVEVIESSTTLIKELENVTVGELTLNGGTLSGNVNVIGPITITGDIFAAPGTEITITGYEIFVAPDVIIGPNVNLIPGYPIGCGDAVLPSTINLSSYCNNGDYKGNEISSLTSNVPSYLPNTHNETERELVIDDEIMTKIYPNPSVTGLFNLAIVSNKIEQKVHISISDATGREVYQSDNSVLQYEEIQVDLSNQATGIYFIQITNNLGNRFYEKIIIE